MFSQKHYQATFIFAKQTYQMADMEVTLNLHYTHFREKCENKDKG